MIRPTSPNPSQQQDFWNNRGPMESFIDSAGEVETVAIIATFVSPATSLGFDGNNRE
jgi:hypothetical protein